MLLFEIVRELIPTYLLLQLYNALTWSKCQCDLECVDVCSVSHGPFIACLVSRERRETEVFNDVYRSLKKDVLLLNGISEKMSFNFRGTHRAYQKR